ncbi:MAG: hypothetical protein R2844_22885 [Caldilineales bacterium]
MAGLLADLNALPHPAWDIFDGAAYPFLTILSSRGCPAGCGFCPYVAAQGLEHRIQAPAHTASEMAFLAQDMNARRIMFRDPVFARDRSRVLALSSELRRLTLPVSWECESRPEHFDAQLLEFAARRRLRYGQDWPGERRPGAAGGHRSRAR